MNEMGWMLKEHPTVQVENISVAVHTAVQQRIVCIGSVTEHGPFNERGCPIPWIWKTCGR